MKLLWANWLGLQVASRVKSRIFHSLSIPFLFITSPASFPDLPPKCKQRALSLQSSPRTYKYFNTTLNYRNLRILPCVFFKNFLLAEIIPPTLSSILWLNPQHKIVKEYLTKVMDISCMDQPHESQERGCVSKPKFRECTFISSFYPLTLSGWVADSWIFSPFYELES